MYNAPEELLERLASVAANEHDIMELLWGQHDALFEAGEPSPPVSTFFTGEADLVQYRQALEWWPRVDKLPPQLAAPSLYQLCFRYDDGPPFVERLRRVAEQAQVWLAENGHNPDAPNDEESAEDRARRLNKDAQRRFRSRKAKAPDSAHAQAVADAYQAYLDACRHRKAVIAEQGVKVSAARLAWETAKNSPPGEAGELPGGLDGARGGE